VSVALLVGGASPAAAGSSQEAATRAVAGPMLEAPRPEALVRGLPARVVVWIGFERLRRGEYWHPDPAPHTATDRQPDD